MRPRVRRAACTVGLLLAAMALVCAPMALATFSKSVTGGPMTVTTSTLAPASEVSANQTNCRSNKGVEIAVTWSASTSSYATSYTVERATASAGPYTSVASVEISKRAYTDNSASLAYTTTYYYRVTAVYRSWNKSSTADSVKTLSKYCL